MSGQPGAAAPPLVVVRQAATTPTDTRAARAPSRPAAYRSSVANVTSLALSPPALSAELAVVLRLHNPSLLDQAYSNASVAVFHPAGIGRTTVPVGAGAVPDGVVPGGGSADVVLRATLSSAGPGGAYLSACAAAVAASEPCLLFVTGSLTPAALWLSAPAVPLELWVPVLRLPPDAAGADGGGVLGLQGGA